MVYVVRPVNRLTAFILNCALDVKGSYFVIYNKHIFYSVSIQFINLYNCANVSLYVHHIFSFIKYIVKNRNIQISCVALYKIQWQTFKKMHKNNCETALDLKSDMLYPVQQVF